MTSVIQVTQDDIEQGIRADCYYCPVALALERTLGAVDVRVYRGSADWMIPPKMVRLEEAIQMVQQNTAAGDGCVCS